MEKRTVGRKSQGKKKHSRNHSGWNYFQNSSAVSNRAVKNNANQKLLSISMLVSGREETTEKSIDSLEKLRRRVPSELILVDTGCSEEMHERLAQKADKIVRFAWCDDFSAARMAGLKEASGQWFMFVDDAGPTTSGLKIRRSWRTSFSREHISGTSRLPIYSGIIWIWKGIRGATCM